MFLPFYEPLDALYKDVFFKDKFLDKLCVTAGFFIFLFLKLFYLSSALSINPLHPPLLDDLLSVERIYNDGVTGAVFLRGWGAGGGNKTEKKTKI